MRQCCAVCSAKMQLKCASTVLLHCFYAASTFYNTRILVVASIVQYCFTIKNLGFGFTSHSYIVGGCIGTVWILNSMDTGMDTPS